MAYLNLNGDSELLKIKRKDDQLREPQNKSEKHDHPISLKSLEIDNE